MEKGYGVLKTFTVTAPGQPPVNVPADGAIEGFSGSGPRRTALKVGLKSDSGGIITLSSAAALLKQITGRRRPLKKILEVMYERPHLALFGIRPGAQRPHFIGVRKARWVYFLQARQALYGKRDLFHLSEL